LSRDITVFDTAAALMNSMYINATVVSSVVENWYAIPLIFLSGKNNRFILRLRSGKTVALGSWKEFKAYWYSPQNTRDLIGNRIKMSIGKDKIRIRYKGRGLAFRIRNDRELRMMLYHIYENFVNRQYEWLNAGGNLVVDIGASVGDTAIYFAANGAKHIYAYEPDASAYRSALDGIAMNRLDDKITFENNACGSKHVTLNDIVSKHSIRKGVLKIDCEGCEYGLFQVANEDTLKRFKRIIIEYHYGYRSLEKRLRACGFVVRHTIPRYFKSIDETLSTNEGLIFAYLP
jgi:hypothetical protein